MRDRKLQVFVSSTYTDLIEERQAAVEAILAAGHIPAGMELFAAGDENQMAVIKRWIDESDVYLLILGGRYGSIDEESGKSYTQLEYEYAVSTNKAMFAVVISNEALDARIKQVGIAGVEKNMPKLEAFKDSVLKRLVRFWDDKKDIKLSIHETLAEFTYRKDLIGWVRGDRSVDSPMLAEEIARLTKENSELRTRLNEKVPVPLYSGLTFERLIEILNGMIDTFKGANISAYDFLMEYGPNFAQGITRDFIPRQIYVVLSTYKMVSHQIGTMYCKFTDDGHTFYIRALELQNQSKGL